MKQINVILCILTIQIMGQIVIQTQQKCLCSDIQEQKQCELINCYWDGQCLDDTCQNKKQDKCYGDCQWQDEKCIDYILSCSDYSTQKSCDQRNDCGWASSEKCIQFKSCSDFSVSEPNLCYTKGSNQCESSSTPNNGLYQCKDKVNVECGILTSKTICNNSQQSNNVKCGWKQSNNQCLAIMNINSCENAKDWQEMCDIYACIWENGICKTRDCTSFTIQETCKYIPNYDYSQISVCIWTEDKCQSLQSSDDLPQQQCFENTNGGYMWINDGCTSCTGYAQFLNIIIMLIIINII
ncbi:unnamed protein product [Paramecium primaurelia]|uniref:Transmembrane protein n=1 Tax=Paramecium primaurelia TaxID=5886 RepID=A0A8S1MN78_PARPR|nr:unnamed protein product [Paramecium primaurelia]